MITFIIFLTIATMASCVASYLALGAAFAYTAVILSCVTTVSVAYYICHHRPKGEA